MTQHTMGAEEMRRMKEANDVCQLLLSEHNCKIEPTIGLNKDAEVQIVQL